MKRNRITLALLIILLTAAGLRLVALADAPPGVTHDEADHALDAWRIVEGNRPVYLTTGYGREPLYDYATAGVMALIGRNVLSPRLTSAFFGMLLIAATYAWTRRLFSPRVALLVAAAMGLGFWPLMVSRHALRTMTLPALLALAMALFLHGLRVHPKSRSRRPWWERREPAQASARWGSVFAAGVLLGLTFYTYIPARVLWLLFPLLGAQLWLRPKPAPGHPGTPIQRRYIFGATAAVLLVASTVGTPLAIYLNQNPSVEVRIDELSAPLRAAQNGNWTPLLENARATLRIFTAAGDSSWRYNLAGRPLLPGVLGPLFYLGLLLALWGSMRHPGRLLALAWLVAGISPSLVTGPFLSTTQAAGMLPVLYLFPALAVDFLLKPLGLVHPREGRILLVGVPLLIFGWMGLNAARDYFGTWAEHPEVRVQYETTLVETIRYLNERGNGPVAVSTTTPRPLFSPAVAELYLRNQAVSLYWFDGRGSFLLPPGESAMVTFDAFAPALPQVAALLGSPEERVMLAESDLNRPVAIHTVAANARRTDLRAQFSPPEAAATFAGVELVGYRVAGPTDASSIAVDVLWEVTGAYQPELFQGARTVHFLHLLNENGDIAGQSDRLDVPSSTWAPGVLFFQRHRVPADAWNEAATAAVGMYVCADEACTGTQRIPRIGDGEPAGSVAPLLIPEANP